MPLYRVIPAGDLALSGGRGEPRRLVTSVGVAYVRQKIASRLKFFLGEWFRDLRLGVPYYRNILVKNADLDVARTLLRRTILSVQEVASITRLVLANDARARTLAVEFEARLVEGGVLIVHQPDPAFVIPYMRAA